MSADAPTVPRARARTTRLATVSTSAGRRGVVDRLGRRMVSPLCGLDESVSFTLRGRDEARFVVAGGQLTGVHRALGLAEAGSYHVGGTGVLRDEALIRTYGESIERYSQLVAPLAGRHELRWESALELAAAGERCLPETPFRPFAPEQYADDGFPFRPLESGDAVTWVRGASVAEPVATWVPAQLAYVGYQPRLNEPWAMAAVTTGCAAHVDRWRAVGNALTELVGVDASMGHWYTDTDAVTIEVDDRLASLRRVLRDFAGGSAHAATFHLLPAPGFEIFPVVCVFRAPDGVIPAVALGLGCDHSLERAAYKALIESVATVQLGKLLATSSELVGAVIAPEGPDPRRIFDFDANVALYARAEAATSVDERFAGGTSVPACDLPADLLLSPRAVVAMLLRAFRAQDHPLVAFDCTTIDARQLGFVAYRLWTPGLLGLCSPSAPPVTHPRFAAFGGVTHVQPHPYP